MRRAWGMLGFATLGAVLAGGLAGCAAAAPADLSFVDAGTRCVDSADTGEAYAAFDLSNTGGTTTLRALDLGSADGLEVLDAWIMPLDHGVGLDISTGPIDIPDWGKWTTAIGSELPGDATVDLVLHLRTLDPSADAFLTGVSVYGDDAEVGEDDAVVGITPGGTCPADGSLPAVPPADGAGVVLGSGVGTVCAASEDGDEHTFEFPVTSRLDAEEWLVSADVDDVSGVEVRSIRVGDAGDEVPGFSIAGRASTVLAVTIALEPGVTQGHASGIRLTYGNDPAGGAIGAVNGGDITIGIGPTDADGTVHCG